MTIAARAVGAQHRPGSTCGASTATCCRSLQAVLGAPPCRRACWAPNCRLAWHGFDFDIGDPFGRRGLRVRRRVGTDRVARRETARLAAHPPAVSGGSGATWGGRPWSTTWRPFVAVAHIARRGGAWWAGMGTADVHRHQGALGVGRLRAARACMNTRWAHPIAPHPGRLRRSRCPGGAGGRALGHAACRPPGLTGAIAFDDVPSAGAFMVFNATRDMFEVARHFARFFAHESCGLCTPCRVGTELVVRRLDKLAHERGAGRGSAFDLAAPARAGWPAAQRHALRAGGLGLQPAARHAGPLWPGLCGSARHRGAV